MDESVINILWINVIFGCCRPQIPFPEEVEIMVLGKSDPDSDVELTLKDQQGSFNVLLDNESVMFDLMDLIFAFLALRWADLLLLLFNVRVTKFIR